MTYEYKGFTFITFEDLTRLGATEAQSDALKNAPLVYLFRASVGSTKLMAYISKEAAFSGDYESLTELYNRSSESIPAINLSYFEHVFGTEDRRRANQPL